MLIAFKWRYWILSLQWIVARSLIWWNLKMHLVPSAKKTKMLHIEVSGPLKFVRDSKLNATIMKFNNLTIFRTVQSLQLLEKAQKALKDVLFWIKLSQTKFDHIVSNIRSIINVKNSCLIKYQEAPHTCTFVGTVLA